MPGAAALPRALLKADRLSPLKLRSVVLGQAGGGGGRGSSEPQKVPRPKGPCHSVQPSRMQATWAIFTFLEFLSNLVKKSKKKLVNFMIYFI